MKIFKLKYRILIPFMMTMTIFLVLFVYTFQIFHKDYVINNVMNNIQSLYDLLSLQMESDSRMMSAALKAVSNDQQLKKVLIKKDRVELFNTTKSLFEELKNDFRITHLYFTGTDHINILRVHNPDYYGDKVDRHTTINAEKTGKLTCGIELGTFGTFALRAVLPWYENKKLVGFVELAEEIDNIAQKFQKIFGLDIYILIKKKYLDRKDWETGMKMLGRNANWDRFPTVVIINRTSKNFPDKLASKITDKNSGPEINDFEVTYNNRHYRSKFFPAVDAANRIIGTTVVVSDITDIKMNHNMTIAKVSAICMILAIILFIVFHRFLGGVEEQIESENMELLRINKAVENTSDALIMMDDEGDISYWNAAAEKIMGYTSDEAIGANLHKLLSPEKYHEAYLKGFESFKHSGKGNAVGKTLELEAIRKGGEEFPVELSLSSVKLKGKWHAVGIIRDITDRKRMEEELKKFSYIDGLTGVANRRHLDEVLEFEWKRMMRESKPISMIMCDIDYFKAYNDTYGHQKGDDCLKKVADTLKIAVKRPADLVARYGGEEFAILLPGIDAKGAGIIAERMRSKIEALGIDHSGSQTCSVVTTSFGASSIIPAGDNNSKDLVKAADYALYKAKKEGRNKVIIYGVNE